MEVRTSGWQGAASPGLPSSACCHPQRALHGRAAQRGILPCAGHPRPRLAASCWPQGTYYEARVTDIDPAARSLTCVKEFCEVRQLAVPPQLPTAPC